MKVRIARFSVSIWHNIYKQEFAFGVQKTDKFIINGKADSVDRIRDTWAYNLLLKCLRGKSQSERSWYGQCLQLYTCRRN